MPVAPPAVINHLARQLAIDIDLGTVGAPQWERLLGVTTLTVSVAATMQDNSDYDSEGQQTQAKTAITYGAAIGLNVGGSDADTMHPTQAKLKAAQTKFFDEGLVHIRYYDREGGPDAVEGWANVQWADAGGDTTQIRKATVTLSPASKWEEIANPILTPAAPVVSSVAPANLNTAGGQLATVRGNNFTGTIAVTGVKFGGTNATSFQVIDDNTISAIVPAHAAGAALAVLVTNVAGGSVGGATVTYA